MVSESLEIRVARKAERFAEFARRMNPAIRFPVGLLMIGAGALFGLIPLLPGWPIVVLGLMVVSRRFSSYVEKKLEQYIYSKTESNEVAVHSTAQTNFNFIDKLTLQKGREGRDAR
jgi:hypothetical protein